ncbi:DUF3040 domain-containing protein [Cumulibacter manganitolerans]|uniref:DUF3040 domain-containing protein n=1 Tax=Cumulibacter manganitolerans TaxID=1884992 RepID=UPI0012969FB6|nr:DUF3040 domain-containing protein [Cumulibacter manganitolerans]
MPLSEHEQRVLEQIERSLYAEDPKFRAAVNRSSRKRVSVGSLRLAILLGILGLAVLVGGVWLQNVFVGVLGFVIMLGGGIMGLRATQRGAAPAGKGAKGGSTGGAKGSMAEKAQERLRRRFDQS